jgi:hypothetical protein
LPWRLMLGLEYSHQLNELLNSLDCHGVIHADTYARIRGVAFQLQKTEFSRVFQELELQTSIC